MHDFRQKPSQINSFQTYNEGMIIWLSSWVRSNKRAAQKAFASLVIKNIYSYFKEHRVIKTHWRRSGSIRGRQAFVNNCWCFDWLKRASPSRALGKFSLFAPQMLSHFSWRPFSSFTEGQSKVVELSKKGSNHRGGCQSASSVQTHLKAREPE